MIIIRVLLHGWQHNHYLTDGLKENLGLNSVYSFLPPIIAKNYGDTCDTTSSLIALDKIDEFDLIIFTPRSFYDKNFYKFLFHRTSSPKVFVDLEDDFLLRNIYKNKEIALYFKRETYKSQNIFNSIIWYMRHVYGSQILPPIHRKIGIPPALIPSLPYAISHEYASREKLRPLPLTIRLREPAPEPSVMRNIDLSFCLNLKTIPTRKYYFKRIKGWISTDKNIKSFVRAGGLPQEDYIRLLKASKASISLRGMGFDTDRYWEIPYYGSVLVSQKIPIRIENNFQDGESAIFFDSFSELKEKVYKYVLKSDEWIGIAEKGHSLFMKYHTPEARVRMSFLNYVTDLLT